MHVLTVDAPQRGGNVFLQGIHAGDRFTLTYLHSVERCPIADTYRVDDRENHREDFVLTSLGNDANHFHPDYFGKGYRWHKPRMEPLAACYRKALEVYQAHDRELFNATAGGALTELPRVDFESIIN